MKKEEIEKAAESYTNSEYIDYGDLNESAEIQIKKAFTAGMNQAKELLKAEFDKEFKNYKEATNIIEKANDGIIDKCKKALEIKNATLLNYEKGFEKTEYKRKKKEEYFTTFYTNYLNILKVVDKKEACFDLIKQNKIIKDELLR